MMPPSPISPPSPAAPPERGGLAATFLRLSGRLRHLATQLLGNEMEADDALYEAFARLWPRREQLATTADEEALLTTAVRHISIDTLRRRGTHSEVPIDDYPLADTPPEEDDTEARYREVQALIAQHLTPLQQVLLRRRDVDDAPYSLLSEELGMQEAAIRQQLSRARKTIRTLYLQQHSTP